MKKRKLLLSILIGVLLILFTGISVLAVRPSENKNYNSSLQEAYAYITGQYQEETYELTDIVAYINEEPVYFSEVLFMRGICSITDQTLHFMNDTDQIALEYSQESANSSISDLVYLLARQRAILLEAEELGISVTDEEIESFQESEKQNLIKQLGADSQELQTIQKEYEKLYAQLGMTEEECNNKYGYVQAKSSLLSMHLIERYFTDYVKEHDVQSISDLENIDYAGLSEEYYDNLQSKMNVKFAK